MAAEDRTNYWLFQSSPKIFQLREALKADALQTFAVKAHRDRIKPGDKVIIWQTGDEAGCYALATVASEVKNLAIGEEERSFFVSPPQEGPRVAIRIDYNIWNRPVTREQIREDRSFDRFYAGLPGVNYKATKKQYRKIKDLILQADQLMEPEIEYEVKIRLDPPVNLILYGPPGTGKTFQTVNRALSIIENRSLEELQLEDRDELRRRFHEYTGTGQIAFLSFHQSFAYEDFVEGIKPVSRQGSIEYVLQDGIFKLISNDARQCVIESLLREQPQARQEVKFNQLYQAFLDYLRSDDFSSFTNFRGRQLFLHRILRYGNISVRQEKSFSVQILQKNQIRTLYRQIKAPAEVERIEDIIGLVGNQTPGAYWAVFNELKKFESGYLQKIEQEQQAEEVGELPLGGFELPLISDELLARCRKYVLIIDEINRGNIPAIFGELITLIEPDKREGRSEMLSTVLPYSKSYFSVPPNLYLIGTMNTSDRSTEALDAALRRRFAFEEMEADPALLSRLAKAPMAAGVDLRKMLEAINLRLELLLNRDYHIGHAYLLNISTLNDLRAVFSRQIIPLLKEYFFNDYGKIGLVLGRDFVKRESEAAETGFADFEHPYIGEFTEKILYALVSPEKLNEAAFIRIYDKNYS